MKKKIWISLAAAGLLGVMALPTAACAEETAKETEKETVEESAEKTTKEERKVLTEVTLNEVAHSIFYAPQYVAIENGYFEEEGIDLTLVTGFGADKVMTALLSGEAEIGFMGSEASIYTYSGGAADAPVNFAQELSTSQAAKDLKLTPTSISRASRQLEEMGLLHIRKVGVQRIMQSEDSPKTLFQKAGDKLLNPIKRTVYIPKELVETELLESGYSALAEYSMLNTPNVRCYAAERISQWKDVMTNSLQNSQVQVAVEMWRYNPRKLSTRNIVDELSLALALREDADERVEEAVEEMLNELWRKIDGYRN